MTAYRLQAKSIVSAFGWHTLAQHDSLKAMAAACDSLARDPDNRGLSRVDPTPCDYRVVDQSDAVVHSGYAPRDVVERWMRLGSQGEAIQSAAEAVPLSPGPETT
jgi:hypothetical protein